MILPITHSIEIDTRGNRKKIELTLNLEKIEYSRCVKEKDGVYAIYDLTYTMENSGNQFFMAIAPPIYVVNHEYPYQVFYHWFEEPPGPRKAFLMYPGWKRTFNHEIKILSNEKEYYSTHGHDFCFDERFFARSIIMLGAYPKAFGGWSWCSNSIVVKYWNNNPCYEPTLSHLLVSTPWRYQLRNVTTDGNCIEYPFVIKNDDLPEILTQRLGWVQEFTVYLSRLTKDIHFILNNESKCFVEDVNNSLHSMTRWVINVCDWFNSLVEDSENISIIEKLFRDYENIANISISGATNISMFHFGKIIPEIWELVNDTNDLNNWIKNKSWEQPITIKGVIKNVRRGETISISCRGKTVTFKDEDDGSRDHVIHYEFMVSSEPVNDKDSYFNPHNCALIIKSDRRIKNIITNGIISRCFSNGTYTDFFSTRDWKLNNIPKSSTANGNNLLQFIIKTIFLIGGAKNDEKNSECNNNSDVFITCGKR